MKVLIQLSLVVLLGWGAGARAESKLGVGFILGSPTALSAKWYESDKRAFDLQMAFFQDHYFLLYGDYLVHFPGAFRAPHRFIRELSPYIGVGPFMAFATKDRHPRGKYFDDDDDDFAIGVRVPFGIEWIWDEIPIGIGLEIAPGIVVAPSTDGVVQGGLTLRYYF